MRSIVFDIEANGLNPTHIWVIVCKDVDTKEVFIFRNLNTDLSQASLFLTFAETVKLWIGHSVLSYDFPVMCRLLNLPQPDIRNVVDTLIISKLVDYPRSGHSLEDYGEEFGVKKDLFNDFSKYSPELVERCIQDVEINTRVYNKYLNYINNVSHHTSINLEHQFQLIVNKLENKGFALDVPKAEKLLGKVTDELNVLDKAISEAFPPRLKLIREVLPKETKYATISLSSIPKSLRHDMSSFTVGAPFSYCGWTAFNPGSPKQVVQVLNEAGWVPEEKTDGHKDTERQVNQLKRLRNRSKELDITLQAVILKLERLRKEGWKISEQNLVTLPPTAPLAARSLAKRILYESRRKTLTEWLSLVQEDGRVRGKFNGIGAWTHRMNHLKPNLANITNEFDTAGKVKLLGKELRQCWRAPKGRLLCGVDAEGIQLRIFAHYVNNEELINALVKGDKKLKTDPHSYNQKVLGDVCKSRAAAKRFLYALFLGAGMDKLAAILECSRADGEAALNRLLAQYPGFEELKTSIIPSDARRGWFIGIDGRKVRIPGEDVGTRRHLAMSGYLQNGEKVIIAKAATLFEPQLDKYDSFIVDIVHDEYQIETPNNVEIALEVAALAASAIREAGEIYNLKCPLAGSFMNDHGDPTIGMSWYVTH